MRHGIVAALSLVLAAYLFPGHAEAKARHHHHHVYQHHGHHHFARQGRGNHGLGAVAGLRPEFKSKIERIYAAMPASTGKFYVGNGCRSHAQQIRLHAAKPGLAARPGHSNHERCLAADIVAAGPGAMHWLHAHVAEFGLAFPLTWENWHLEPQGLTRLAHYRHHRRYASLWRMRHSYLHVRHWRSRV
jgi:hypothetical protein